MNNHKDEKAKEEEQEEEEEEEEEEKKKEDQAFHNMRTPLSDKNENTENNKKTKTIMNGHDK